MEVDNGIYKKLQKFNILRILWNFIGIQNNKYLKKLH